MDGLMVLAYVIAVIAVAWFILTYAVSLIKEPTVHLIVQVIVVIIACLVLLRIIGVTPHISIGG